MRPFVNAYKAPPNLLPRSPDHLVNGKGVLIHRLAVVSHFVLGVHERDIPASATPEDIASTWSVWTVVGDELIVTVTAPKAVHSGVAQIKWTGAQIVVARSTRYDVGATLAVQPPFP
jgi:hypothetical protein